ncbi:MAG: 50S ribosomal protein L22 [Amoebophilaceae bacterium]|jgi:large subunit ribosomal protein L22|nr:50S ribosomal protein L22 [Amoebophilaceae bacterium]
MQAVAKLKNLSVSPRKVRLVADLIRGAGATQGLAILKHTSKKCAIHLEKLLLSAVSNWERKNENVALEEAGLCIKAVWVDGAGMLKRLKPAPQGRAHRIRKRSSHITLIVDSTKGVTRLSSRAEKGPVESVKQTEENTDGAKS